jgi:hypothetical protein
MKKKNKLKKILMEEKHYRKAIKINNPFKVKFICLEPSSILLEKIEEFFPSFLSKTNFGTRQSKGFGSYYIDKKDENYIEPKKALDKIDSKYIYAKYDNQDSKEVFKNVEIIYPLIKTGINYPDHPNKKDKDGRVIKNKSNKPIKDLDTRGPKASYFKSYLFQYMLKKGVCCLSVNSTLKLFMILLFGFDDFFT